MHDRLVAHAHCHAALAVRTVAAPLVVLHVPTLLVRVLVIFRLAPWTLGRRMHQSFLRTMQLCLLVWLHRLLLRVYLLRAVNGQVVRVPDVDFGGCKANDGDLFLARRLFRQNLLALTAL